MYVDRFLLQLFSVLFRFKKSPLKNVDTQNSNQNQSLVFFETVKSAVYFPLLMSEIISSIFISLSSFDENHAS